MAMKRAGNVRSRVAMAAAAAVLAACGDGRAASGPVEVAAKIDHAAWDGLLKKYVDERGLVGYAEWKSSEADRIALRRYLDRLAAPAGPAATGADRGASLVNAYNALTISWILENYPTRSIQATARPFKERRHRVGGRSVSLDDLEHGALRPAFGYRVHATLVCAARSCPPLSREPYDAARLEEQLDSAMRVWLAREDLNRFEASRAQVSPIFKWFQEDFERAGGVVAVLRRHGPVKVAEGVEVEYLDYDWTLNDKRPPDAREKPGLQGFEQILPRGRIAAIDKPKFVPAAKARIGEGAWVLGAVIEGQPRAFSLALLNSHEIVNDRVGQTPYAAVW